MSIEPHSADAEKMKCLAQAMHFLQIAMNHYADGDEAASVLANEEAQQWLLKAETADAAPRYEYEFIGQLQNEVEKVTP